jgi:hypothetical protein
MLMQQHAHTCDAAAASQQRCSSSRRSSGWAQQAARQQGRSNKNSGRVLEFFGLGMT